MVFARDLLKGWPFKAVLALCVAFCFVPTSFVGEAPAQSWRDSDPSAIVLPSQPDAGSRRSRSGGLFRIFRFEPQRQRQRQRDRAAVPEFDPNALIDLPAPTDPDALTVVALGDEFAEQMREGLVDRFSEDPLIDAQGTSIPGSGLTDFTSLNWNIEALRRLDAYTQVGAVVVALGYSDRRSLVEGERTYAFGTSAWQDAYSNRITSFALTLTSEGYPVIFVGLPPMADPQVDRDVRLLNQVLEEAVAPTRARFVSVYEGFADIEGNYVSAGPNMAGVVEDLRRSDGVFFNRAGREKYAHFVERFIPRDGQQTPEPDASEVVFEGSGLSDTGVGPVLLMTSGFADPTGVLATNASSVLPNDLAMRARLVLGRDLPAPSGRADNFQWVEPTVQ